MEQRPAPAAQGNFARTPFAHVLLYVRERRLSGTLAIQADDSAGELAGESLLVFEQGALGQVRLPTVLDPLGFVLRERGAITDEALNESLSRLANGEGLQGDILVAMAACDDAAVEWALREQVRRKALRLFDVDDAPYQYHADVDLLAGYGRERVAEDVLAIVWRGVRNRPDQRAIEGVIARVATNALRLRDGAAPELRAFGFDRAEQGVIDVLRCNPATVDQLLRAGCDPRIARALIYVLVATKQVEIVPAGTVTPSAPLPRRATGPAPVATRSSAPPPAPSGAHALPLRSSSPLVTSGTRPATGSQAAVPPRPATGGHAAEGSRISNVPPTLQRRPSDPLTDGVGRSSVLPRRGSSPDPGLSPELQAQLAGAEQRLASMENETYFQMLSVPTSASSDAIRATFLELAGRWHPDRAPAGVARLREVYSAIFSYLNEAHSTLTDDKLRARYMQSVQDGGGTPVAQKRIVALVEAATDAQKAEVCLRVKDYAEAERLARGALRVSPDDPNTLVVLASVLIEKSPTTAPAEAETLLVRASEVAQRHDRAHYLLGVVYKRQGESSRALRHFQKAVEFNPKNLDAAREVRVAEMRTRSSENPAPKGTADEPKGSGFLSRFLKK